MLKGDTVELEVKHHFSDGLYARELFIPAGVCLVGRYTRRLTCTW